MVLFDILGQSRLAVENLSVTASVGRIFKVGTVSDHGSSRTMYNTNDDPEKRVRFQLAEPATRGPLDELHPTRSKGRACRTIWDDWTLKN